MTTDGGSLCRGHCGIGCGSAHLAQGARQILGIAGNMQVPNVKYSLVTNIGGQYMDAQVIVLGSEIP
ncbi:MAG: hypothetical protein QXH24_02625 [Candidatus Bathyarchaeia archaeon]